jgi:GNAT superfamily N-acetyltransferase
MKADRYPFEIRLALPGEAQSIASVLEQAFIEYKQLYTPEAYRITTPRGDQIQDRWAEGPVWVAVMDGRLAGTISAVPVREGLYLRSMAVLPEARGYGVGKSLLQYVEDYARARGFRRISLSTTPFLLPAIRLYEQSGFQKTAKGPHDLAGTPLFTMEKYL